MENFYLNKKKLIKVGVIVFPVLIGSIAIACITIKIRHDNEQIISLTEQKTDLEIQIKSYGNPISVFTVKENIMAGSIFDKIEVVEMPTVDTLITDQYVTNLADIENYIYKLNVTAGTPLTYDLFTQEVIGHTDRYYDIVADIFPIEPRVGQYYDLRMVTPRGIDYIVLSKKRVHSFYGTAAKVILNEEEIHQYQSSLVDCFLNQGTYLYVDVYVEPSMQKKASIYYPPSEEVLAAMELDPNIVALAQDALMLSNRKLFEQGLDMSEDDVDSVTSGRSNVVDKIAQAKAAYESVKAEETKGEIISSGTTTTNTNISNTENNSLEENNPVSEDKKQIYEDAANFLNEDGE